MVTSLPIPKTNRKLKRREERLKNKIPKDTRKISLQRKRLFDEQREAQKVYERVLRDQVKYAEIQKKKEIQDQKRETVSPDRPQPSGLAGGGRRD